MVDLGFVFPLVIARSNECCDVAIEATAAFRYARFPRSLRSLGMTCGRFGIYFSVCHCEKQRMLRRGNRGEAAFRSAGFPRSLRSLGMTYGRFGIYFSACHSEEQHRCDVAIEATAAFRSAGFLRSLRSLGMTSGNSKSSHSQRE